MKQCFYYTLLVVVFVFLVSCGNNSLVGKTFFFLDGKVNYSTYYASLNEMQVRFISDDKLEAKMTMYADALGYRIITDSSREAESKILSYSYKEGFLSLPSFNIISKLTFLDNGDILTNENEYLYSTSIVNSLGTNEAIERLKQDSKGNSVEMFKRFIEKPYKPLLRKEGGMLKFNEKVQERNESSIYDDLQKQFADVLTRLDSLTESGFTIPEEQITIIKDLKQRIGDGLRNKNGSTDNLRKLIQKFDLKVKDL